MVWRNFYLLAVVASALLVAGCQNTGTKNGLAVYAYSAGPYSETVTLRPDGRYVQSETQDGSNALPGEQSLPMPLKLKQTGTWRLLDKQGGKTLPLPTSPAALPTGAVVELHKALPFGLTWENRSPATLTTDRTISASEFRIP